ncbi:MAG: TolB family protein [Planctomycetota bacterium]|jgi:Tol biopolymer transport system component
MDKRNMFVLTLVFIGMIVLPFAMKAQDVKIKRITPIKDYGKSLDWSATNDLILSAKRGSDRYFDVFVMNSDGSGERCLTCDKLPKHNGNPAWHPSGEYIVFTAEKEENPSDAKSKEFAIPGTGFNCDLWVMTSDGEKFYPLTDYPIKLPYKAVIHPQFSHDGKKLLWAERVDRGKSFGGGWVLRSADFVVDNNAPHLENTKTYKPGKQRCFYESHDFSKDDKKILFSGNLQPKQTPVGLDIYELDLESNQLIRLTTTDNDWDEHAHYSPDGKKIAWMSSTGFDIQWGDISEHNWQKYLKTELWIMDADGSNKQRLTHFNTDGYPEYLDGRRCLISDSSWSPDGKSIVALLACETQSGKLKAKIIKIELE